MCKSESDEYFTTQCKERQLQEILVDISLYVYNDGLAVKSKYKDTHWISDWYHQRTQHVTCSFFVWLKWIFLKISLCCKQKNFTWKRLFDIPQVTRDQESKELECQPWCCGYMYWQYCILVETKLKLPMLKQPPFKSSLNQTQKESNMKTLDELKDGMNVFVTIDIDWWILFDSFDPVHDDFYEKMQSMKVFMKVCRQASRKETPNVVPCLE